jgi:transcriptional regulator with XRE-family HTH domain
MSYQAKVHSREMLALVLQQSRLASGMTQRDLAARLGISQRYVSELEAGKESKAITRVLAALAATGAVMTIDVPEFVSVVRPSAKTPTEDDLKDAHSRSTERRERNRKLRKEGLFGVNDYN